MKLQVLRPDLLFNKEHERDAVLMIAAASFHHNFIKMGRVQNKWHLKPSLVIF